MGVALFTRAWIEIGGLSLKTAPPQVALFTRAWIEMPKMLLNIYATSSPSSRGRGLKFFAKINRLTQSSSPSSRGRGLKSKFANPCLHCLCVALFTRAWIEICCKHIIIHCNKVSPSSRGRGLKFLTVFTKGKCLSRPLHEGVD